MSTVSKFLDAIKGYVRKSQSTAKPAYGIPSVKPGPSQDADGRSLTVQQLPALVKIPPHRKKLLFISSGEPRGHGYGMQISFTLSLNGDVSTANDEPDDPSTIYASLPVHKPKADDAVPKLGYYPSYSAMTSEQRAVYGQWLCDISNAIEVGYVFLYFYGLERHLVSGDFDSAVDEIINLRKYHKNASFQSYSASALVHSCFLRKRLDTLQRLYTQDDFDYFGNSNLLALHHSGLDIMPDMLIRLAGCLSGVNRRYLKEKSELYKQALIEILKIRFGKESYPFASRFPLQNIEGVAFPIFANISLPSNIRSPALPNLLRHAPFQEELGSFFQEVHEATKLNSRARK